LKPGNESSSETEPETRIERGREESLGPPSFESYAGESCEILVTETQIIEICRIPAKSLHSNASRQIRASERASARKHSGAKSAKYYQTRKGRAHEDGNQMEVADPVAVSGAASGTSKNKLKKWFERARRAFVKSRGHNFRAS